MSHRRRRQRPGTSVVVCFVLLVVGGAGCGMTRLQSARTVPRGQTRTTVAFGTVRNDLRSGPEASLALPLDVMVRHGATERVDWGVRLFFGLGLLGDVKWNLLPPTARTALALSLGAAAAVTVDPFSGASEKNTVLHVPAAVTFSHEVLPWLIPYGAIGYGGYWIFGREAWREPGVRYAARSGSGDGLVMLHAGVELARASGFAFLVEYAYAHPVVNDPGDWFRFAANHFISIGLHTGR